MLALKGQNQLLDAYQMSARQSNFELLRNISMFMILMLHANFVALGFPSRDELLLSPPNVITRYSIEALSISSVNAFVFISGWFGIHPSVKSVFKFIYQILFFLGFLYLFFLIIGKTKLSFSSIIDIFQLSSKDWFVKSYFVLMILAPLLNLFTRYLDHGTQIIVLLSFFLFEIIYGWMGGGARFFLSGFGPLHMIGIYILAQYIKITLSQEKTTYSSWIDRVIALNSCFDLLLFFFFTICTTALGCFTLYIFGEPLTNYTLAYNSPFVIAGGGIFVFVLFKITYLKYKNYKLARCK